MENGAPGTCVNACGGVPVTSPEERRHWEAAGRDLHGEDRGAGEQAGVGGQGGQREDGALMSRFHKPPGVKTKHRRAHCPTPGLYGKGGGEPIKKSTS